MQTSSLVKWVDEIQGQIDALKRTVGSKPAPVADSDCIVFSCGHATCEVSDVPLEESNDNEFYRFASANFTEAFDLDNYNYYISFDFASSAVDGPSFYGTMNCNELREAAPLSGDVFPVISRTVSQGAETCAVAGILNANFNFTVDDIHLEIVSEYGDGTGIAPDETGVTGFDYVIFAKKKAETINRKSKNRRK
jgi:hypothetical protein